VVNRPLISYELEWLRRAGVKQVLLAVAHQAEALRRGLGEGSAWGLEVEYVEEQEPLDTAGALKNCAPRLLGRFWALNGDLIFDFDPAPMVRRHCAERAVLSLTLRRVEDILPFGLILCDQRGRVTGFREKVSEDPTGQRTVNAGIYLMEPEALASVPPGRPWSNERDLFPDLVASGATVLGFQPETMAYWLDVGRLDTYLQANRDVLSGAVPWVRAETTAGARLEPGAQIHRPCSLAEGVVVHAGAQVGPFVSLGAGVEVGERARLRNAVVLAGATIGPDAELDSVVVTAGDAVPPGHQQQGGVFSCG
jgi:mannose-1-phosphate guanylyltransferase